MGETVSTIPSVVGTTPGVLRLMNSRAILDELLRDDASRTVTELSRTVGLSRPTVEAALADLVDEGWVTEAEAIATPNKAGRRAKRFAADATAGSVLGVDLGLHGIVGIRADLRGNTLTRVEERYADLADAEQAWTSVQDVVRRLTADAEASPVLAATFGVPAVVDRAGEIDYTVAVPEWVERRVPGRIQDLFPGIATFFDNDAKLAATAEAMWGRFRGVQDGLYLVMGRQIGAAYVIDGVLARGARGAAGEMGGLASTGWPGAPARLEARIASDTDLESVFVAAGRGGAAPGHGGGDGPDPAAVDVVRAFADDVAPGVVQLVTTIDPEVVVVGGEVLPAAPVFAEALAAVVTPELRHPVEIVPSTVGRDAVARGALARSLTHVRTSHMGLG
ncbi:ROK family transcriptional regulator [Curtobacterium sp. RIT-PI-V]|uniref:ROK family transcriptional regulator n=1 Tax=Curtobacterium sp. RIT-PI-V TaxID=3035296 RepID=UPI0021D7D7E9|nr:ROK family transcriptional regulator [Curtobacterium sp. RIT-PI-V]